MDNKHKSRSSKYSLVSNSMQIPLDNNQKASSFVSNRGSAHQLTQSHGQNLTGKKTVNMHSLSSSRFQNNPNNSSLNTNQQISINGKLNNNQKNYLTNADRRPMLSAIQKPRYAGAARYEDENFNGSQSGSNLLLSSQSDKKFVNSERLSLERRSYDQVRAEKGNNGEGFSSSNDGKP